MDTFQPTVGPQSPPSTPGYDAVRRLGSGGQGQVWLMSAHNGSEPVAAKFLGPGAGPGSGDMNTDLPRHNASQLTGEWRVLSQFQHEHLIGVRALVQDVDGGDVLLMDFAPGGSLGQVLAARGVLSVGEAVTVLTPIGQVLAFLHGRGAVHGDVSPANILFSAAGKPLLSDFGLGRLLGQEAEPAGGTPGFACPQDGARDEAGDVFALAAVGWFSLTGQIAPPTRDRPPLGTLLGSVPSELVAALEAGLNEDPAQRPTAAAFAQAVFRSAPAEAMALGNAVHPSVLPLLPTYHEPAVRGRRRARSSRAPAREARRRFRPAPGWRRGWGGRGTVRGTGVRKKVPVLLAALGLFAALAVVAAMVLARGWAGIGGPEPPGDIVLPADPVVDMAWAGALPAEIQDGVLASEPVAALHALAWLRSFALSNADQALLEQLNVADSSALAGDLAIVAELRERGHTLTGYESRLEQARTVASHVEPDAMAGAVGAGGRALSGPGAKVVVRATVLTGAFAEQDSAGVLVHRQTEEQSQELDFVLVHVGQRWRIGQITAVENN